METPLVLEVCAGALGKANPKLVVKTMNISNDLTRVSAHPSLRLKHNHLPA